ncbi:hypothetical protein PAXINDRAFT_98468 [Paxillus involutus ATCC 200175]|nr:hypothetical protein PAXINDRAFT_98468 [Paxillus involutus ATCC 200175]
MISTVLILRQDPAQWRPAFERPWFTTSVSAFRGRIWHQFYTFSFLGSYPLSIVFGRVGGVFGTFFASAVFHLITLNGQMELRRMLVSFGMMALAGIDERVIRQWTGRKVSGLVGWVWTMAWVNDKEEYIKTPTFADFTHTSPEDDEDEDEEEEKEWKTLLDIKYFRNTLRSCG